MDNRIRLSVFVLLILFSSGPLFAKPHHSLQTLLQRFSSFKADFSQQTGTGRQAQHAQGKLVISKPNQFWWYVSTPNKQYYISNGTTLWNYQVDLQQITQSRLSDKIAATPLALLSGDNPHLDQLFTIKTTNTTTTQTYTLTPKAKESLTKSITLQFKQNTLIRMRLVNTLSQITDIQFSHVILNQPIDKTLFNFKPPTGVDVIRQ